MLGYPGYLNITNNILRFPDFRIFFNHRCKHNTSLIYNTVLALFENSDLILHIVLILIFGLVQFKILIELHFYAKNYN